MRRASEEGRASKARKVLSPEAREVVRQVCAALALAERRTAAGDFLGALRVAVLAISPLRALARRGAADGRQ
jgi:hypothetical protein